SVFRKRSEDESSGVSEGGGGRVGGVGDGRLLRIWRGSDQDAARRADRLRLVRQVGRVPADSGRAGRSGRCATWTRRCSRGRPTWWRRGRSRAAGRGSTVT